MTKDQFIKVIAQREKIPEPQARKFIDAMVSTIVEGLSRGEKVSFSGFGNFSLRTRRAHQGVHPKTGAKITIPATTVAHFKAGRRLKAQVRASQS